MKFTYRAMDSTGQESWGDVEADKLEDATAKLRAKGLFVTQIKPANFIKPQTNSIPPWFAFGCLGFSILVLVTTMIGISMMVRTIDANNKAALEAAKTDPNCQVNLKAVRILMHLPNEYTFVVEEDGEYKFYTWGDCIIKWVKDARPKEPIRVEGYKDIYNVHLTVHLHDASEIDGAGWQRARGKFTETGNTDVIE